jgi:hypothetical protein
MKPGVHVVATGVIGRHRARAAMLNPIYDFLVDPAP